MLDQPERDTAAAIATARWADPDYIANRYYFQPGDIWIGRNPHNNDQAIGYRDKRHVLVCAGTRSGKGRSFVVNNLALWPGSTVTYDPKGELPHILAARRGDGDEYCDGMGQDVFVLDPLNHSGVDERYQGYFDPLWGLDREDKDGELVTWCKRIATALIDYNENTESGEWGKRAVRLVTLVIMHVVTSDLFKDDDRSLMTVLRLLMEGAEDVVEGMKQRLPREEWHKLPDPMMVLLDEIAENQACRGWIASDARSLKRQVERTPKFFESVRGESTDKLDWLKSAGIEKSLRGWGDPSRRFDPSRLKTDPTGVSVFIVLPVDDIKTYGSWLQTVFTGIFAAMRQTPGAPATGHQVLCMLDEFSSLGYQDYIASSLDNIAGAGMKLTFIVQNFGKMKKLYSEEIESFFTNCGLELYFGKIGQIAEDHVSRQLGQTEVIRLARSRNQSHTRGHSGSTSIAFGQTRSHGGSESHAHSTSNAISRGRNWNWSSAVNWSDTENWGRSDGKSMGRNYGPHVFFEGWEHSTNYGTSLSRNHGGSHTSGGSRVRGGGRSEQLTRTQGQTHTTGSSWQNSTSRTETETKGWSTSETIGSGVAETFHKKPLLEPHEMNLYLRPLDDEDFDMPAYPGMMLVRISGENPFFVRRSNYDQDPYFERCFTPDPHHDFIPLKEQRRLGFQYTEQHVFDVVFPAYFIRYGYHFAHSVRPLQRYDSEAPLFTYGLKSEEPKTARAIFGGRVMALHHQTAEEKHQAIMTIRADAPMPYPSGTFPAFDPSEFNLLLEDLKARYEAELAAAEAARLEEEARKAREFADLKAEAERRWREDWFDHAITQPLVKILAVPTCLLGIAVVAAFWAVVIPRALFIPDGWDASDPSWWQSLIVHVAPWLAGIIGFFVGVNKLGPAFKRITKQLGVDRLEFEKRYPGVRLQEPTFAETIQDRFRHYLSDDEETSQEQEWKRIALKWALRILAGALLVVSWLIYLGYMAVKLSFED